MRFRPGKAGPRMDADAFSTTTLFARIAEVARSAASDDAMPWTAIRGLCDRPTGDVVEAARRCCHSPERRLRLVGTDILAELVERSDRPDATACDAILMPLLGDADPGVVAGRMSSNTSKACSAGPGWLEVDLRSGSRPQP